MAHHLEKEEEQKRTSAPRRNCNRRRNLAQRGKTHAVALRPPATFLTIPLPLGCVEKGLRYGMRRVKQLVRNHLKQCHDDLCVHPSTGRSWRGGGGVRGGYCWGLVDGLRALRNGSQFAPRAFSRPGVASFPARACTSTRCVRFFPGKQAAGLHWGATGARDGAAGDGPRWT